MQKKAFYYIDDFIWSLRDLTRQRPESVFDHHFFGVLKQAHDLYGAKFQLNLFYRTDFFYGNDEFTLADMTDAYKEEFSAASDWLKFSFHSKQEFPDYPFVNASYEDVKSLFEMIRNEVYRFAGENSFGYCVTPHWGPLSKEGCRAMRDCGVKVLWTSWGEKKEYSGDPSTLPYGHAARLLCDRKPETMLYTRKTRDTAIASSICGYNHVSEEEGLSTIGTFKTVKDPETGLHFKVICGRGVINLVGDEELETWAAPFLDCEYLCFATHEQYSHPFYFNYQPTHTQRILRSCELIHKAGYTFFWAEELGD